MKRILLIFALFLHATTISWAQTPITFPDVPGYQTLTCDFHMHTVFSDGKVWPNIRVEEARRDGLDAIAITEHLEYQPHHEDIPHPDRNRAYEIAQASAEDDLLIIHGSEITRGLPPGHSNAIFLRNSNALLQDDPVEVFREARKQGAFIFWNHPNWVAQQPDGLAVLTETHQMLIREDLLHGIEVVNELTYSDEALQIALDHDLTILGTSDIHGLVDWQFHTHRPVTLVFATERSTPALKEALMARRTVVWFDNTLIGRLQHLQPLLKASITVAEARYIPQTSVLSVTLANTSDATFLLENRTDMTFHNAADVITLPPHMQTTIDIKTGDKKSSVTLAFEVLNAVTAPGVHPVLEIPVELGDADQN